MKTSDACLQLLSKRMHTVWLQKLSETTYVGDIKDLKDSEMSHIPPKLWRGCIQKGKWHYGNYTKVLNDLVLEATSNEDIQKRE